MERKKIAWWWSTSRKPQHTHTTHSSRCAVASRIIYMELTTTTAWVTHMLWKGEVLGECFIRRSSSNSIWGWRKLVGTQTDGRTDLLFREHYTLGRTDTETFRFNAFLQRQFHRGEEDAWFSLRRLIPQGSSHFGIQDFLLAVKWRGFYHRNWNMLLLLGLI